MIWDPEDLGVTHLACADSPDGDPHHLVTVYRRKRGYRQRESEGVLTCIHCGKTAAEIRRNRDGRDLRGEPDHRRDDVDLRPPAP